MSKVTPEQELAALVETGDYRLTISDSGTYLHVRVIYAPAFRAVDMGGRLPLVTNDGVIGHKLFGHYRRWPKATRWVRRTIKGHRELLALGGVRQVG